MSINEEFELFQQGNSSSSFIVELKFDCNRLSEGIVHRELVLVDSRIFDFSLDSLYQLIERELNIPRICILDIFADEVKIDGSFPDFMKNLSKRASSKLKLGSISLRYYTSCTRFTVLRNLVERFETGLRNSDYHDLFTTIDMINRDHIYGSGWGSYESTGVRLYLVDIGFINKLYNLILEITEFLISAIQQHNKVETTLEKFISRLKKRQLTPTFQISLVVQTLTGALGMLWNFGANVEDRHYLYERGFFKLFRSTLEIAVKLHRSKKRELVQLGNMIFTRAFGVFGAFAETRQAALDLGSDHFFMLTLTNTLYTPPNVYLHYDPAMASLILFFLTSHTSISQTLIASNTHAEIATQFTNRAMLCPPIPRLSDVVYNIRYFVCLTLLNMLKTPGTEDLSPSISLTVLNVWMHFLQRVGSTDIIAWFERDHHVIWGTLEPFISLFIIPKNSFLGLMQSVQHTGIRNHDDRIIEFYLKIARFTLEVVLRLDKNREQIFEENLFTHLIFADWKVGGVCDKLREYFPNLIYFPVPSLYDISALTSICEGLGEYSTFYYS